MQINMQTNENMNTLIALSIVIMAHNPDLCILDDISCSVDLVLHVNELVGICQKLFLGPLPK